MRNKIIAGVTIAVVLLSAAVLLWYFTPSDVSIISLEAPDELVIGQLSSLRINLQNNASEDVNVTINVKNAFVDEKGESLNGFTILAYANLSYNESNAIESPQKEIRLEPGRTFIEVSIGYQVPGAQKIEVEVYELGKLADYRTIEINIPKPKIVLNLWNYSGVNGTNEIHAIYGDLQLKGKGYVPGVVVNISVINELTNATVSKITRTYSLNTEYIISSGPLVVWEARKSLFDPVTGARTTIDTQTFAPIVVIELSKGEPSAEKYILSPIVVKGKAGERYRVNVTATWRDQVVNSELRIPS